MQTSLELFQFPYSHYNEKARWALDYKRVPHVRHDLMPGPHAFAIQRLTGQSQVPVIRVDGEVIHGSARILEQLERRHPQPPLFPTDPALRARALEIEAWFDAEVGPCVRRALFATLLHEPGYVCHMFSAERGAVTRALYRAALPLTRFAMKRGMGITDAASIEDGLRGTREGLDFVAKHAGAEGCLVGDRFSVADLTAASLLAPAVGPPDSPMALPEPHPARLREWLERWADHPGAAWVREQYRRHRSAPPW